MTIVGILAPTGTPVDKTVHVPLAAIEAMHSQPKSTPRMIGKPKQPAGHTHDHADEHDHNDSHDHGHADEHKHHDSHDHDHADEHKHHDSHDHDHADEHKHHDSHDHDHADEHKHHDSHDHDHADEHKHHDSHDHDHADEHKHHDSHDHDHADEHKHHDSHDHDHADEHKHHDSHDHDHADEHKHHDSHDHDHADEHKHHDSHDHDHADEHKHHDSHDHDHADEHKHHDSHDHDHADEHKHHDSHDHDHADEHKHHDSHDHGHGHDKPDTIAVAVPAPADLHGDLIGEPKQITAFLMGLDSPLYTLQIRRNINNYKAEPLLAIMPGVTLRELWRMLGLVEKILLLFSAVVVLISLLGMLTTLLATLNQRRRELAILRSVGARPRHIFTLMSSEAILITAAGCTLGIALFYALIALAQGTLQSQFGISLSISLLSHYELMLIGVIMAAGTLMGILPATRAYFYSLSDGMSIKL
ncbi:hypothetical protein PRUB_a1669 [Pseudoalteromonas rubra]|nr:hypothetical protein PRUB_a1669 [Pseudoalteromonas rubra]